MPQIAGLADILRQEEQDAGLLALVRRFGQDRVLRELDLPASEVWAAQVLWERQPTCGPEDLDSLPFESLCRSVLAPLLSLAPALQQKLFGWVAPTLDREAKLELLGRFVQHPTGLTSSEKVGWLTGEGLGGRRPWSEDRLLNLLALTQLRSLSELRQRMLELGGVGPLAASLGPARGLPLASRVVTQILLSPPPRTHPAWGDLFRRCSPLQRFVVVSRLTGKLDLYWSGRSESLLRLLAQHYQVDPETLLAAHALEDLPRLVERLETRGAAGLQEVVLRPLAAFRPALAQVLSDEVQFPRWVECKYDGIRLLLHKELDGLGNLRFAAYTRRRNDWSELLPGLQPLLASLTPYNLILDGELHGRVLDLEGVARPATVYEVHQCLRGELSIPLRYIAFDLLYCNGQDLTQLPLSERRRRLEVVAQMRQPAGLPLELAQGSLAQSSEELNRLYQQFRRQGHEGCIVKDLQAPYPLASRSPAWQKRKPLETLDLVVLGAFWGEGGRSGARLFDSYSLAARVPGSAEGWKEVGTAAGVDQRLTAQLVGEIVRHQLLTGRDLLRQSSRGSAQGVELRPFLVVTVAYEDLLWDRTTSQVSLRSPRILGLRSGEMPLEECCTWAELERKALRSRLS